MGCIGSHLSHILSSSEGFGRDGPLSTRRRTVFPVLNVDELGRHISPGKLEVTEGDLVLHINGRPSLIWPLRCLRRYGYENDLFSFEAGRRCPTGPGIYAFKCSMAQTLFELLQAKIQGNPLAQPIIPTSQRLPTSAASAHANLSPLSLSPTFDYVSINDNQDTPEEQLRNNNSGVPDSLVDGDGQPLYVNVESSGVPYTNFDPTPSTSNGHLMKLRNGLPQDSHTVLYTNIAHEPRMNFTRNPEVNYAELDLEQGHAQGQNYSALTPLTVKESPLTNQRSVVSRTTSVSSRTVTTETATAELGYATIDFDRTAALSVVTRSKIKLDFGFSSTERDEESEELATTIIRKTRHNSTVL